MKCTLPKDDGSNCNANAMANDKHCFFHSTDKLYKEQREVAQSKGGKANAIIVQFPANPVSIKGAEDVVSLLEDTINQVRAGKLDVRIGNCIGVLSGQIIKAIEVSSVANRVEIIERAIFERRTR